MSILNTIKKPYKIFADVNEIEYGALEQFASAMVQDFVVRGALMPDVHQGYSLPIGAVVETENFVVPSWVGYDIGCGMCAISTDFSKKDIWNKGVKIRKQILRNVPVGFNKHNRAVVEVKRMDMNNSNVCFNIWNEKRGDLQLGTLGGGNHFIEIGSDEDDVIWIIIHSGSRGIGHAVAQNYMRLASPTGKASEGHFGFEATSSEGVAYLKDMNWCLRFALLNRKIMIRLVIDSIRQCGIEGAGTMDYMINRNHNHVESRDGTLWIHRKGATHAEGGMLGVVPGNSADGCFIVRGKGNKDSLNSSSHGAGRILSRRKAKETLDLGEFESRMRNVIGDVSRGNLDESPSAYKDIFKVMKQQEDLVHIEGYVKPIISVKG